MDFADIQETFRVAAGALQAEAVPFVLGGGLATWSYGGPESHHDVDLMVEEQHARRAQQVLVGAGMRAEDPPEDWLLKAWHGEVLVDLIFRPTGVPVDRDLLARSPERDVLALRVKVLRLEDVFVMQLLAMHEHHFDYPSMLKVARAVREQVDWAEVAGRTADAPFAVAFLTLLRELGIVAGGGGREPAPRSAEYVAGWVVERLAEDPRVHEQGIQAAVEGDELVLRGSVATTARRESAADVAGEVAPDLRVRNEMSVLAAEPPTPAEPVT